MQEMKGLEANVMNPFNTEIEQWNSRFLEVLSECFKEGIVSSFSGYYLLRKFCWNTLCVEKSIIGLLK